MQFLISWNSASANYIVNFSFHGILQVLVWMRHFSSSEKQVKNSRIEMLKTRFQAVKNENWSLQR